MKASKRNVQIKLITEIFQKGNKEVTKVEESGTLFQREDSSILTFTERYEDQEDDVQALITISPERVSVKRTGAVDMHQIFKKKQTTENVYRHAYGTIHMETFTDQITFRDLSQSKTGQLFISYLTKLNGEESRRHRLTLSFKEEKE
ncbi:DUF1934 domain-containing protein [Radiobacillus kanasensis]|uniref:DUF1934 domain-containing protein n=1 Tax=Radiobacillus kanasensis TaxID=2844358 RepID=UPI001E5CE5A9|nr:DUF1934 domain-containing protein [Radiobacillus kanasensis]UFT98980.1 DUF1934 domain-containing protein [Radiobacillus kanasensis]